MVVWIIGLSGSGKSVLGQSVYNQCLRELKNIVFIDGDVIREIFGNDLGFSITDRWKNAKRISKLCKFLDDQGIHVICSVLSLFHESQKLNRENYSEYFQVYIETPLNNLINRDSKKLYQKALNREIQNVVGVDIDFPIPLNSDMIIDNSSTLEHLLSYTGVIANLITKERTKN